MPLTSTRLILVLLLLALLASTPVLSQTAASQGEAVRLVHHPIYGDKWCTLPPEALQNSRSSLQVAGSLCGDLKRIRAEASGRCVYTDERTEQRCIAALPTEDAAKVKRPWVVQDTPAQLANGALTKSFAGDGLQRQIRPHLLDFGVTIQSETVPSRNGQKCNADSDGPLTADQLGVYAMYRPDAPASEPNPVCTATQVTQQHFLTAAHCLTGLNGGPIVLHKKVGNQTLSQSLRCCQFPTSADRGDCAADGSHAIKSDLAICTTAPAVPFDASKLALITNATELAALETRQVFVGGFGQYSPADSRYGAGPVFFTQVPAASASTTQELRLIGKVNSARNANTSIADCAALVRRRDSGGPVLDMPADTTNGIPRRLLGIITKEDPATEGGYFAPLARWELCDFVMTTLSNASQARCSKAQP